MPSSASQSETVAERKDRDWDHIQDDRKTRGLNQQTDERKSRRYVDDTDWKSEVNNQTPHGEDYLGNGEYTSSAPIPQGSPFPQGIVPDDES